MVAGFNRISQTPATIGRRCGEGIALEEPGETRQGDFEFFGRELVVRAV